MINAKKGVVIMSMDSLSNLSFAEKVARNLLAGGMTHDLRGEPSPMVKELAEKIRHLQLEPQLIEITYAKGWHDRIMARFDANARLFSYESTGRINRWGYRSGCGFNLQSPKEVAAMGPMAKYALKGEASWIREALKELQARWNDYRRTTIPK